MRLNKLDVWRIRIRAIENYGKCNQKYIQFVKKKKKKKTIVIIILMFENIQI